MKLCVITDIHYNYYQFRNGLNIDFKEKNHYFYENRDS